MSDWKTHDLLTPDQQKKAAKLLMESERARIDEYEFCEYGGKLKQRLRAVPVKSAPKPVENAPALDRICWLEPSRLADSPTQPRSHYDEERLAELTTNVRERGILDPLLAREVAGGFELIKGHRRKRAALAVGLAQVPVIVREYTDEQVVEIQLLEIVQSEAVDPIDEARSLQRLLEFREPDGSAKYKTAEALAGLISKSHQHVLNRLRLLRCPREFQDAIQRGTVGEALGYIVAGVPSEWLRQKLAREVLKGYGEGPMSWREAKNHVRAHYMVELRNSPFDLQDVKLVPVREENGERSFGGACTDCPFNSANMPDVVRQTPVCTLPTCFEEKKKCTIEHVRGAALKAGGLVIEGQSADRYVFPDGTPKPESGMINLDQVPTRAEISGEKKAPKWRAMVEARVEPVTLTNRTDGSETEHEAEVRVKPVVVIDAKGRSHELVERKLAIAAASQNGFSDLFSAKARRSAVAPTDAAGAASQEAEAKRKKAEASKKKLEAAVAVAAVEELIAEIAKRGLDEFAWAALLEVALFHSAYDARDYVCARRGLTVLKGDHEQALRLHADTLTPPRMPALVVELLLAGWVKASGVAAPGFRALWDAYELDLKPIRERVKTELAEPKAKPKKPKPEAPVKPVRELIGELAKKHGLKSLAKLDDLSMRTVGKPYEALQGGELNQLLDAIKALPSSK